MAIGKNNNNKKKGRQELLLIYWELPCGATTLHFLNNIYHKLVSFPPLKTTAILDINPAPVSKEQETLLAQRHSPTPSSCAAGTSLSPTVPASVVTLLPPCSAGGAHGELGHQIPLSNPTLPLQIFGSPSSLPHSPSFSLPQR